MYYDPMMEALELVADSEDLAYKVYEGETDICNDTNEDFLDLGIYDYYPEYQTHYTEAMKKGQRSKRRREAYMAKKRKTSKLTSLGFTPEGVKKVMAGKLRVRECEYPDLRENKKKIEMFRELQAERRHDYIGEWRDEAIEELRKKQLELQVKKDIEDHETFMKTFFDNMPNDPQELKEMLLQIYMDDEFYAPQWVRNLMHTYLYHTDIMPESA